MREVSTIHSPNSHLIEVISELKKTGSMGNKLHEQFPCKENLGQSPLFKFEDKHRTQKE